MGATTPVISYNLKERGRKYRGKERHFNIKAIVDAVNSPETQERVANRDMTGFFGHWPRIRFGMNPAEGGIAEGKAHAIEPAIVTTLLRAHPDGTIEHQTEFLDTATGQIAARMYGSKVGGFSSAIDPNRPEFFGFDYVNELNYSTNRGYTLDDVNGMTYDDVVLAEQNEQNTAMLMLLDSANSARDMALESLERLQVENEQLLSILASRGQDASILDSVAISPVAVSISGIDRMKRDAAAFMRVDKLPEFIEPKEEDQPENPLYQRLLGKFLR